MRGAFDMVFVWFLLILLFCFCWYDWIPSPQADETFLMLSCESRSLRRFCKNHSSSEDLRYTNTGIYRNLETFLQKWKNKLHKRRKDVLQRRMSWVSGSHNHVCLCFGCCFIFDLKSPDFFISGIITEFLSPRSKTWFPLRPKNHHIWLTHTEQ